jgi:hypothetical protein
VVLFFDEFIIFIKRQAMSATPKPRFILMTHTIKDAIYPSCTFLHIFVKLNLSTPIIKNTLMRIKVLRYLYCVCAFS